jgi:hypothetical protein
MRILTVRVREQQSSAGISSEASIQPCIMAWLEATKVVFEIIVSMDPTQYRTFGLSEWCILTGVIINAFVILSTMSAMQHVDSKAVEQAAQYGRYLELLSFRAQELSRSKGSSSAPPDIFCFWHSVLGIVHHKYTAVAKEVNHSVLANSSQRSKASPKIRISPSLCPVLNGSLKSTDYWTAWSTSNEGSGHEHSIDTTFTSPPGGDTWESWDKLISGTDGTTEMDAAFLDSL